LGVRFPLWAR